MEAGAHMSVRPGDVRNRVRISVSLVTHNNADCLKTFFGSLARQKTIDFEILCFDNASTDSTMEILESAVVDRVNANPVNSGYSRGHNENCVHASADYILIVNPDLVLDEHAVSRLVAHMDQHPEVGIAGPRVSEGEPARLFPPRRFYPGEGMIPLERGFRRTDNAWVNGCCMIARRSVFESVGGFDEDFFLYQAESDLCLRMRRAGHKVGYCDDAVVHHLHRQSQREDSDYEYARHIFSGNAIFWQKHYSSAQVSQMARFQRFAADTVLAAGRVSPRLLSRSRVAAADRLRARRDECDVLLQSPAIKSAGGHGVSAGIFGRQLRIGLEWILQGRFPLDDY